MKSLKDALLKAGIKGTPDLKENNKREKISKKKVTDIVKHQVQRNFCEQCELIQPDVELYIHRNPTTDAEWMCVLCADRFSIPDQCRKTAQSDTSIKKMFRREYGVTLTPTELNIQVAKFTKSGPVDGNR